MISDYGRRWRALRAWFDAFPPDDQERLLGQMEHTWPKASFTRVGNSADSRGLAQCCATMCCTLPNGIEFS
jgi:hypothetical protein